MTIKLGRVVTYNEEVSLIKLHDPSFTIKHFISSLALDQRSRWRLNRERLPPINTSSREVTWQCKTYIISPLSQCLWSPDLSGWWYTARSSHPWIPMTTQWGGLTSSRDKLNILSWRIPMNTKLRQSADSPWKAPTLKASWPFDHMINVRWHDNLKNSYLLFHKTYGHWTRQSHKLAGSSLTHFSPVSHFYTPWKRQKTKGFLTFSGGIEMWHWTKMG